MASKASFWGMYVITHSHTLGNVDVDRATLTFLFLDDPNSGLGTHRREKK